MTTCLKRIIQTEGLITLDLQSDILMTLYLLCCDRFFVFVKFYIPYKIIV